MSYEANFNIALTYIRSGLTDRAAEALNKSLSDVPVSEKTADNAVYLRILANLARVGLETGRREEAMKYLREGLSLKSDHTDLLFLHALYLLDEKRYDETTAALINYLVSLSQPDTAKHGYEFVSPAALKEVYIRLIPAAYSKAIAHKEIINIVEQLSDKTGNEFIQQAYKIMQDIDEKRRHENAQ